MTIESLLADLVCVDSVNPDLVPGGAGESAIVGVIAAWANGNGLETHIIEPVPGRPSIVVVAHGSAGGRSLMLNGHIDTVGFAGMAEPLAARVEDGRLSGRGAYDMKGSVAACLWAAMLAQEEGLRGDVIVACVADEEVASLGTQAVLQEWTADACIVTEPTGLDVCIAHKGFVWIEVDVPGRAAHGSKPDLGVDAIARAGRILTGVENLDRKLRAGPAHPLLGTGSVHLSLISGGQEMSSYPERCHIGIERRTVPGETAAQVEAEIQSILDRARDDAGVAPNDSDLRAEQRITLVRDPFEVPADAAIVDLVRVQAERVIGVERQVYGDTPWMDAALTAAAGIPTVVFGPEGAGAHAVEEWVDLQSVQLCADVLFGVAREFCA